MPSVLVTHQLADAQAFADRLAVIDDGLILQVGAPDEVVLRPAVTPGRRTRRLPGLRPRLRCAGRPVGVVAGVHPDRVIPGADPDRGLVVTGTVTAARPSGAGWEADVLAGDAAFTCRLPSRPVAQLAVTVLDPPYFAADGVLLTPGQHTRIA